MLCPELAFTAKVVPFTTAARKGVDLSDVPLVGAQELDVLGSLPLCVRLIMYIETDLARSEIKHVFLHAAVALRPDLAAGS